MILKFFLLDNEDRLFWAELTNISAKKETLIRRMQVDSAGIGKRETDLRLTPGGSAPRSAASKRRWAADLTWTDIPWFRNLTKMPIVLKGIQSGADALLAYENGLDGIVVSNHGGRNQDTARPSLEVLIEVMATLRAAQCDLTKFEARFFSPLLFRQCQAPCKYEISHYRLEQWMFDRPD